MAAGRIKGLTIEIGGDTTKLVSALSRVDNAISKSKQNIRDLDRALKLDPTNVTLIKDRQLELGREVENTENKVKKEKAALEELNKKLDEPWDIDHAAEFEANAKAAENLKLQIDLDEAELKQLKEEARNSASVMGTAFQAAGEKIQEVGNKISSFGDKIKDVGSNISAKVTAPIVAGFGASVKAAVDWETAFTGVKKTVDESAEGYAQLAENIKQMAKETASSKEDIAGVMEIAGQLGISGVDNLTEFTRTMIELGDTTNLSAEDAATALARFMNITGESTLNVDKIGSAIVDLGNNFATSESEITEMATRLASAGTLAGLSSTDILALSAAMSSVGIQAEAGGTAMTQTLTAIEAAVSAFRAGSTEDLEAIANIAGLSANDFATAWEQHPIGAVQNFIEGLGELDEKGESATLILGEIGMSGVRQSNMLKSLALASDMLGEAVDRSSTAYQENTALQNEASLRYETMASKMSQLKERFTEIAISIGEMLMPYVEKLMGFIESLIEKWNGLDESQQKTIITIAAIAAAVGPILVVIGSVVSAIGTIVTAIGTVLSMGGALLTFLATPAGLIALIVAAIALLAVAIYENWDAITAWVQGVVIAIQEMATGVMFKLIEIRDNAIALWEQIKSTVIAKVTELKTNVVNAWNNLKTTVITTINNLKAQITSLWTNIKTWLSTTVNNIKSNVATAFDNIKNNIVERITTAKETIISGMKEAADYISSLPGKFLEWGRDMIQNLIDGIKEKISGVVDAVSGVAETIASYIHFSEPDRGPLSNFHTFMPDMIDLMAEGIASGIPQLEAAMNSMAGSLVPGTEMGSSSIANTVNITVYGAEGQDVNDLADIIQDRINMNVYRNGAAFA